MKMNRTVGRLVLTVLALLPLVAAAVPSRPDPPRLVNDLAGVLGDTRELEDSLQAFAVETGNQICVVTVTSLEGHDKAYLAYQIGQEWGVGGKEHNNGVVILVKPKTDSEKGEAFIATGYGLEGAITDYTATQIVNREMIPRFKENDYAGGVLAGVKVVRDLARGEYSQADYAAQEDDSADALFSLLILIFIVVFFITLVHFNNRGGGSNTSNTGTWGGPIIFGTGGRSSDWGSFGGGGFGGGGGWGGFGGGSFGGGGGGGSW